MSENRRHPANGIPEHHTLHPIFGIYCRTETATLKAEGTGSFHVHYEAYMDDPVKKTWTVAKVVNVHEASFYAPKDKNKTTVHRIKEKISFQDAVTLLAQKEAALKKQPHYTVSLPDAPMMGFIHFKAFAEREGYVFDENAVPRPRPTAEALPAGGTFTQQDIDSAHKNLQRPDNEFDGTGPASKTPHTHFLLDQFNRAAHDMDYDTALSAARMMNLLDRFVEHVEDAHEHMQDYCKNYHQLGQGQHMLDAQDALDAAAATLHQLKAYGVNTEDFSSFLLQCDITCAVLHAEGLYDLMNRGLGDFAQNEQQFKARVDQALEAFKQIDDSDSGMNTLKNMIVQTPAPVVPFAIGHFIKTYRAERPSFGRAPEAKKQGSQKPPQP